MSPHVRCNKPMVDLCWQLLELGCPLAARTVCRRTASSGSSWAQLFGIGGTLLAYPGAQSFAIPRLLYVKNTVSACTGGGTLFVSTGGAQGGTAQHANDGTPQPQPTGSQEVPEEATGETGLEQQGQQPIDEARAAQLTFDEETGKFVMSQVSLTDREERNFWVQFSALR